MKFQTKQIQKITLKISASLQAQAKITLAQTLKIMAPNPLNPSPKQTRKNQIHHNKIKPRKKAKSQIMSKNF